jgi:hypothetical protein
MTMTESDQNFDAPAEAADAGEFAAGDEIIALPDPGYRWKHLIMAVLMIAGGMWFAYDGWVKWPAENRRAEQVQREKEIAEEAHQTDKVESLAAELSKLKKHTEMDLLIQKMLACALPAFGIFWGAWTLRETRGQYRMAGDTIEFPGHPPITFENIRRIDKRRWDRKGVAFLHYEHGNPPAPGIVKLDDFAYERKPTDEILERIEKNVVTDHTGLPM